MQQMGRMPEVANAFGKARGYADVGRDTDKQPRQVTVDMPKAA